MTDKVRGRKVKGQKAIITRKVPRRRRRGQESNTPVSYYPAGKKRESASTVMTLETLDPLTTQQSRESLLPRSNPHLTTGGWPFRRHWRVHAYRGQASALKM